MSVVDFSGTDIDDMLQLRNKKHVCFCFCLLLLLLLLHALAYVFDLGLP